MNRGGVEEVIRRLVGARRFTSPAVVLAEGEIRQLCAGARDVFMRQPNLLELDAPINICGSCV